MPCLSRIRFEFTGPVYTSIRSLGWIMNLNSSSTILVRGLGRPLSVYNVAKYNELPDSRTKTQILLDRMVGFFSHPRLIDKCPIRIATVEQSMICLGRHQFCTEHRPSSDLYTLSVS